MVNFRGTPVSLTQMNVHFLRVPLYSVVPEKMSPVEPGQVVGGCWYYRGPTVGGGQWFQSLIKYSGGSISGGGRLHEDNRVGSRVFAEFLPGSFPECDRLLQTVLSTRLDSGDSLDSAAADDGVDQARLLAEGVCDEVLLTVDGWTPVPVEGPADGCPGTPVTGIRADGSFVLNWGERHYDCYGASACWVRSPEGEWGGYLRPKE